MGVFFNFSDGNAALCAIGFAALFVVMIFINEVSRRTKIWGIVFFIALPCALAVYFIILNILSSCGVSAAQKNYTILYKNKWYDYFRLYAAVFACAGFTMIRHGIWLGKREWFKPFPMFALAVNICIGLGCELGVSVAVYISAEEWLWHLFNVLAGLINLVCITGYRGIYISKKKQDVLCPNLTGIYILAFSLWNFSYLYSVIPSECLYGGLAVLLASAFCNIVFNRGGWLQNRMQILSIWYMALVTIPLFGADGAFSASAAESWGGAALSIAALAVNVFALIIVIVKGVKQKKSPYRSEIFTDTAYYRAVKKRMETDGKMPPEE